MSQQSFGWKQVFAILALIGIVLSMIGSAWIMNTPTDTTTTMNVTPATSNS